MNPCRSPGKISNFERLVIFEGRTSICFLFIWSIPWALIVYKYTVFECVQNHSKWHPFSSLKLTAIAPHKKKWCLEDHFCSCPFFEMPRCSGGFFSLVLGRVPTYVESDLPILIFTKFLGLIPDHHPIFVRSVWSVEKWSPVKDPKPQFFLEVHSGKLTAGYPKWWFGKGNSL